MLYYLSYTKINQNIVYQIGLAEASHLQMYMMFLEVVTFVS